LKCGGNLKLSAASSEKGKSGVARLYKILPRLSLIGKEFLQRQVDYKP
jgi:hypothetical protein